MQELFEFMTHHWGLWLSFVVILALFVGLEIKARRDRRAVSPQEAIHLMNKEEAKVFDVRDDELYRQSHIKGAQSVAFNDLMQNPEGLAAEPTESIVLVCQTGQQSAIIASQLRRHGFHGVHVLEGGMRAWLGASLPTEKNK